MKGTLIICEQDCIIQLIRKGGGFRWVNGAYSLLLERLRQDLLAHIKE